jgi:choline kinase
MAALTAVVLAAGVGRRLGRPSVPKSLLPLTHDEAEPTFLGRHVGLLRDCGVDRVLVVLSEAHLDTARHLQGVDLVVNPFDTSTTGSTLSLLCGLRAAARHDGGLLVTDADIVYERALLEWVIGSCARSAVFLAPQVSDDDEEVRVYGRGPERPVLIGKGLSGTVTAGLGLLGESLGIIHVAAEDRELVQATARWLTGWPEESPAYGFSKERSEHEELWQYCLTMGRLTTAQVPAGLAFAECDTPDDYAHIRDQLFPAIVARDGRRRAVHGEGER